MKNKERLDNILVSRAMFPSRETARTAIMDGAILVDGTKVTKAGTAIGANAVVEIIKSYKLCPYVSRGGLKLERALKYFALNVKGRIAIDAGASTGGFTDCLLKGGVRFVYAVDVGYGQLDWSLRQDSRVKVLERVNIRNLKYVELYGREEDNRGREDDNCGRKEPNFASEEGTKASPGGIAVERADLAVMDVSFISVTKTLPALLDLLARPAYELIVLIKPQFEAGRQKVGKGGVVRDFDVHVEVLDKVISFALALRHSLVGLTHSPIKGPQGNIEYLLYLKGGTNCPTSAFMEPDCTGTNLITTNFLKTDLLTTNLTPADWVRSKVEEAFSTLGPP